VKRAVYSAQRADPEKIEAVGETLIGWFRENARDLPWRRTRDPWRILVSEVMLQQIQVVRAIPFYERFLERFPTVDALAKAPLAEAIQVWGDLGRYRRVVSLHRTARIVVEVHGGVIPSDTDALVKLPGIGPYTAGAVACFAFERDVAFVDTNMRRVLHRVFVGAEVPGKTATERELLDLAAQLVPSGDGWKWNQALMEFGALRCTARKPACEDCPLQDACRARPEVKEALARLPRGAKKGPGYRYEDTNRYYRGRVLAQLREDASARGGGIDLRDLGRRVREGFNDEEVPWLYGVVESLESDGLAVAEERAAYGSDGGERGETRVRLP
jgi:A/G-specific adenine glycosylase